MSEPGKKWDPRHQAWVDEYEPFDSKGDRKFVSKFVIGWVLLGVLFIAGISWMYARPAPDRATSPSSPTAGSSGPGTTETEQSLTAAAADFVARNPYTEENDARLRLILGTSGCEVAGLSILPGVNREPLDADVYREIRRYGPKYLKSEGLRFTFLLKVSCPN